MSVSLPFPPMRLAAGSAPLVSSSEMVSAPSWPSTLMTFVLAVVAMPPAIATAPPLTNNLPPTSRLTVIVLLVPSPVTVSTCVLELKLAETAKYFRIQ